MAASSGSAELQLLISLASGTKESLDSIKDYLADIKTGLEEVGKTDTEEVSHGLRSLVDHAKEASEGINTLSEGFNKLLEVGKLLAGGFLDIEAFKIFKELGQDAAHAEALATGLYTVGRNAGLTRNQLDETVETMKSLGIYTDVAREQLAKLIAEGVNPEVAAKLAKSAQSIALATGKDQGDVLKSLTQSVARGSAASLARQGIYGFQGIKADEKLKPSERPEDLAEKISKQADAVYSGSGGGGAQQSIVQLTNAFKELKDTVGDSLLPIFVKSTEFLTELATGATYLYKALTGDALGAEELYVKIGPLREDFEKLKDSIQKLTKFVMDNKVAFEVLGGVLVAVALPSILGSIAGWVIKLIPFAESLIEVVVGSTEAFTGLAVGGATLAETFEALLAVIGGPVTIVLALVGAIASLIIFTNTGSQAWEAYVAWLKLVWAVIKDLFGVVLKFAADIGFIGWLEGVKEQAILLYENGILPLYEGIKKLAGYILDVAGGAINSFANFVRGLGSAFKGTSTALDEFLRKAKAVGTAVPTEGPSNRALLNKDKSTYKQGDFDTPQKQKSDIDKDFLQKKAEEEAKFEAAKEAEAAKLAATLQKTELKEKEDNEKASYDRGLTSLETYLAQRRANLIAENQIELRMAQQELAAEEKRGGSKDEAKDHEHQLKVQALRDKITEIEAKGAADVQKLENESYKEREKAAETFAKAVTDEALKKDSTNLGAVNAKIVEEYNKQVIALHAVEGSSERAFLDQKLNADLATAAIKANTEALDRNQEAAQAANDLRKAKLETAYAQGQVTAGEKQNAENEIISENIRLLQQRADALRDNIAQEKALGFEDAAAKDQKSLDALNVQIEQATASIKTYGQQIQSDFTDAISNALDEIASRAKSLKEIFRDLAKSILSSITKIATQNIAQGAVGQLQSATGLFTGVGQALGDKAPGSAANPLSGPAGTGQGGILSTLLKSLGLGSKDKTPEIEKLGASANNPVYTTSVDVNGQPTAAASGQGGEGPGALSSSDSQSLFSDSGYGPSTPVTSAASGGGNGSITASPGSFSPGAGDNGGIFGGGAGGGGIPSVNGLINSAINKLIGQAIQGGANGLQSAVSGIGSFFSGSSGAGAGLSSSDAASLFGDAGYGAATAGGDAAVGAATAGGAGDFFAGVLPDLALLAGGGEVSGPGGPTDDAIHAKLSDGEFVVNAKQTKKYGALLHALNSGKIDAMTAQMGKRGVPKFAGGGKVGGVDATDGAFGMGTRIINTIDGDMAKDFMNSAQGERIVLNHIKRNGPQVRNLIR